MAPGNIAAKSTGANSQGNGRSVTDRAGAVEVLETPPSHQRMDEFHFGLGV